jgi:hypothetical protein
LAFLVNLEVSGDLRFLESNGFCVQRVDLADKELAFEGPASPMCLVLGGFASTA